MVPIFFSESMSVLTKLKRWIPLSFREIFLSKTTTSSSRQSRIWGTWSWAVDTFSLLKLVGRSTVLELRIYIFPLEDDWGCLEFHFLLCFFLLLSDFFHATCISSLWGKDLKEGFHSDADF